MSFSLTVKRDACPFRYRFILIMKLTVFFTVALTLQTIAETYAQRITLSARNATLQEVMNKIQQQQGYSFFFLGNQIATTRISVNVKQADLSEAMDAILSKKDLDWYVEDKTIVITRSSKRTYHQTHTPLKVGQQHTITGRVSDHDGEPLEGVTVRVKGADMATTTDSDGRYAIAAPTDDATLSFSLMGFKPSELPIAGQTVIDVSLEATVSDLDEVIVVGYGTQKKTSVTAAVSTMKAEQIKNVPTANLSNNLGGRLSGVIVKQGSGEPGRDGSNIFIRGISTMGANQPLLIVDGIPRNFQQLDPNAIESFTVLKDAAAVAPYGVAGANGVVLVTTKKGQSGKTTIAYNGYVGFQNPTTLPKYVNSVQFAMLKNEIAKSEGLPLPYSEEALRKFADGSEPDVYSPDYALDFVITDNSPMTYHNLEMTGGTDRIKYYAGLGYLYQQGMWNTAFSNRYNLNLNIEGKVSDYTTVSLNLNGRVNNGNYPNSDMPANATARIMELIGYAHPGFGPMVFSNGMYGRHAMGAIFGSGYLRDRSTGIFTQLNIEQQLPFFPGLKLRGTVAYDPTFTNVKGWATPVRLATIDTSQEPHVITNGIFGETKPSIRHNAGQTQQFTYQAGLDYLKSFRSHQVSVLGLFEARANNSWSLGATRRNYSLSIDEIDMGSSSSADMTTSGTSAQARQIGLVYRVAYDYAGKYLVEASGRYDGHYFFAPEKRFGFFPAFSAGWRLSEENFLKNKLSWLDNLKIRASYGEVGALAGSAFQYLSTYNVSGPGYKLGGNAVQIVSERAEPNPNITWERAKKTDVGLEISLLNNLIQLEADYFYEKRSNMLVAPDVVTPLEYGIGLSQVNAGIMENKGFELAMGFNYRPNDNLFLQVNGTFTYAKNRLLQTFENTVTYNNPNRRRTGRPLGTQFGYHALGFFQPEDFESDGTLKPGIATQPWGAVQPGDIRYEDVNADGRIDVNDEVPIGDPNQSPRIIYGLSPTLRYKNWSIEALFQGVSKTNLYHGSAMIWAFFNGMNAYEENLDYWRPDNRDAKHPRLTGSPTANNTQTSSFWMRDASYLRLKNLTLGYQLPESLVNKIGFQQARLHVSSQNMFTWTAMVYWDPESNYNTYPQQKVISFGVNLSL